jgi:hypothetical protein
METKDFLEFDRFRIDLARRVLLRGGQVVPLPAKAFDLLLTLLQKPGDTISEGRIDDVGLAGHLRRGRQPYTDDIHSAEGVGRLRGPEPDSYHSPSRLPVCRGIIAITPPTEQPVAGQSIVVRQTGSAVRVDGRIHRARIGSDGVADRTPYGA